MLLDAAIEDAAQAGVEGTQRLLSRTTGHNMTRAELERARQRANDVGRAGEELIDGYFAIEQANGNIEEYEWVSADNAIAPYDFVVKTGERRKVEVKSTFGEFGQIVHVSIAELIEMRGDCRYDLYRVYALDQDCAKLRIATDLKPFAEGVLAHLERLPEGVTVDSISIKPERLAFGQEIAVDLMELTAAV